MNSPFAQVLSEDHILTTDSELQYFGKDVCQQYQARPSCILLPHTVGQVVDCVKIARANKIGLVPSGGRTGYSAGATATNGEAILSLVKLNQILEVNSTDRTMRVQAGVPLEIVQNRAREAGFFYPIDFTSRGSCLIGGTIATNAGGIRVIRYGLTRDWVLGLKVVTGTGELLELNGSLFKNQTGYDLRQCFIGSEGTLGIIVEATLKLASSPSETHFAFCAFKDAQSALPTLKQIRSAGFEVALFEYMESSGVELVLRHNAIPKPFDQQYPFYAAVEVETGTAALKEKFEQLLADLIENETLADVALSQSSKQYQDLMALRELIGETANQHYIVHKNDISVPLSSVPAFVESLKKELDRSFDNKLESIVFGHLGDGNLHVNLLMPKEMNRQQFWDVCESFDGKLFSLVKKFQGSVSAEHGVGLLKKAFLPYSRSPQEIMLMKGIKSVFDPDGIMNPGKIF